MEVELLYFDDCPNWRVAAALLDEVADERGDVVIRRRLVTGDEEARRLGFYGSPSMQVGGVDLFAPPETAAPGLSCRVYRSNDGFSGAPTIDDLRAAIARLTDDTSPS